MEKLGDNVRKRRQQLGMTQDELADLSGYTSRSSVAKIEKGLVDLTQTKIIALAKALQCDPGIALAPKSDQVAAGIRVELLRRRNNQEAALVAALVAYSPKDHPELQISLDGAVHLVRFDRERLEENLARIIVGPAAPSKAHGLDIPL